MNELHLEYKAWLDKLVERDDVPHDLLSNAYELEIKLMLLSIQPINRDKPNEQE